jgi:hypothetical protein
MAELRRVELREIERSAAALVEPMVLTLGLGLLFGVGQPYRPLTPPPRFALLPRLTRWERRAPLADVLPGINPLASPPRWRLHWLAWSWPAWP